MTSLVFVVFEAAMQLCSLTFLVTTLILMSPARTSAESDFNTGCSGFSVTFRFLIDEDVVYEHVLEGHVYRRSTVTKATECHGLCRDDCRCVSMNYITNSEYDNCELNEANRHLEPASLRPKTGARYYELVRQYMVGGGKLYTQGKDRCRNQCCMSNPCLNGATCEEVCDPEKTRFSCTCVAGYSGKRCEKKLSHAQSCNDHTKNGAHTSGIHTIVDKNGTEFHVHCDFMSEPEFTWTLVQSYSYANNDIFTNQHMSYNVPLNEESLQWNKYRLSRDKMQHIADHSTHLRFTCNFETDGLVFTDYARAKLEGFQIFDHWYGKCRSYERLNIRGVECHDCTAASYQRRGTMFRINTYSPRNCQFDATVGAVYLEQNFGRYKHVNPTFRCVSSATSTTQLWFGSRT